jgi:hypothetical protein
MGLRPKTAMKANKAFYNVQATRDGIIVFAFQRRKPIQRRDRAKPKIDADGICDQYPDDPDDVERYSDWGKGARMTAITTHLNVRRLLRQAVEEKLVEALARIGTIETTLTAVEQKLDAVVSALQEPGRANRPKARTRG